MNQKCVPHISTSINRISVYIHHRLELELAWIYFFCICFLPCRGHLETQLHMNHASCIWQPSRRPTCLFRIWKFSTDHAVYILDGVWLAVFSKKDENVCMRQPTLLKFNDIDSHNRASQNMLLVNVIDQLLQLDFEHSGYQIWSILRLLSEQQCSLHLKPLGVASECNKRIRATGPSANCHGILIILNHATWTYY